MSRPDVSIVLPTHNRRDYLARAVASCVADQDGVDLEVLVVDDGSTDGTRAWLESLEDARVRPLHQAHEGPQAARNRGMEAARGRYLKFLDDDDWLAPGALRRELDAADSVGADLCAGDVVIWEDGEEVRTRPAPVGPDAFAEMVALEATTHNLRFLYARDLTQGLRWDPDLPVRQDIDFTLRAGLRARRYVRVDGVVGYVRHHHGVRVNETGRDMGPSVHLEIVHRLAEELADADLSPARVEAIRLGLWRLLHSHYIDDPAQARRSWALLRRMAPGQPFRPPRPSPVLTGLDRVLGPMAVEALTAPVRRLKRRLRSED